MFVGCKTHLKPGETMSTKFVIAFVAFGCIVAGVSTTQGDTKADENVTVKADETIEDDLYVFGDKITVEGTIKGDLLAAGREIVISGTVEGDVLAAAQNITIEGKVLDDVRIAGQTLFLNPGADIGDDLSAAGFSLECAADSHVGGEAHFGGYQATFGGTVDENLISATANCLLSGKFGRNVDIVADGGDYQPPFFFPMQTPVDPIPPGLTIEGTTVIVGDLSYQARREADKDPQAQIAGTIEFEPVAAGGGSQAVAPTITQRLIVAGKYFAALFVVGLLMVVAFPDWTKSVTENIQRKPMASIGWGLVSGIAVVVVAFFLLVATIAVAILLGIVSLESLILSWVAIGTFATAALVAGFMIFAVWISKVLVSLWAGGRVTKVENWNLRNATIALIIGLLIFVALRSIPWFGGILSLLVTLCGVGAAVMWLFSKSGADVETKPIAPVKSA
jgi:cytoskeletal protein CcmA (bactofilin family)